MSSKSDRSKGAGSGVAMSAGDASQDLQPVRFGSSESEAQVRSLLSKADTMRVRVRLADEQDVEGHLFGGGDKSLVLALQLSGDDDVEGHAISIHFPDAEQARRFRNELLAAGVLTATLAMGVGTGVALAPHQTGTAAAPASQATVFMDTSAQAREGGAITQSAAKLAIPVGSASDIAQKAQAAESGVTGPALKTQTGSQSKGAAAINQSAAADAARTEAGITGSLAGSSSAADTPTRAREGGAAAVNQSAAADAARTAAGITGSLAGSTSAADSPTKAREGGALVEPAANPMAAADAARSAAGITGSLAGSTSAADSPTLAREGGALSQSSQTAAPVIPQAAAAPSAAEQINAEIAKAQAAAGAASAAIPKAAAAPSAAEQINAEIAKAQAAAASATDTSAKTREGGALSQSSATSSPKIDYSGKPLPPEPTSPSDNTSSQSGPSVDYSGKPVPTE